MFGSKKNNSDNGVAGGVPSNTSSHALNSIVQGTIIEGFVTAENDIRIDGTIKGSLKCKAKVIIGPSGFVDGDVDCANAMIEGKFEGNLTVTGLLDVRESAKISGDVSTNKLVIQAGAYFNVVCKMAGATQNGMHVNHKNNNIVKKPKEVGAKIAS